MDTGMIASEFDSPTCEESECNLNGIVILNGLRLIVLDQLG